MKTRAAPRSRSRSAASPESSVPSSGDISSPLNLTMRERSKSGSMASLAASGSPRGARVHIEGNGNVELIREVHDTMRRGADGSRIGDAAEVDERSPRNQVLGDVFRREQLVGGRAGAVEGERAVTGLVDLHEGERGARGLRLADTRCLPSDSNARRMKSPKRSSPRCPRTWPRRRAWRRRPPRSPARRRGYEPQLDVRELIPR